MGERNARDAEGEGDSALTSFVLVLSFLEKPADPEQLRHLAGKGSSFLDADDLVRLAKKLDVQARKLTARPEQLSALPLPAIAGTKDGGYLALLQVSASQVLVFEADAERPRTLPREDFDVIFSGTLVLLTTRERVAGARRAFDVSWFIPALVRYRHILRDVLIASPFLHPCHWG